ncbi:hypothetical protein K474DRAFT_726059 [Panus rudis PR-1116 ss-1]|nr:hypothetical protein K474DRAFT_726059 [Panus rudis PR-1116 ss-1]
MPQLSDWIFRLDFDRSWKIACEGPMRDAECLVVCGDYTNAVSKFREAISSVMGDDFQVPLYSTEGGGYLSPKYVGLTISKREAVMRGCNGIGECLMKVRRNAEVNTIQRNSSDALGQGSPLSSGVGLVRKG